jgi:hypothetical protein
MKTTAKINLQVHDAQELIDKVCAAVLKRYDDGQKRIIEDIELQSVAVLIKGYITDVKELQNIDEPDTRHAVIGITFKARTILGYFHDEECDNIAFFVDGKEVDLEQCINEFLEREVL